MLETIQGNLYDYPKYYDLVYGSDWKAEFDFLEDCFEKHTALEVRRVYEPACGTGRLMIRFAGAGYEVAGVDLNPLAVDYCNDRLERAGFERTAVVGDMCDFTMRQDPIDAAFNTINSFRHLATEKQARQHLECVVHALRPGGIYVLGLHLTPTTGTPIEEESWSARRGNLAVLSRMWVTDRESKGPPGARRDEFRRLYAEHNNSALRTKSPSAPTRPSRWRSSCPVLPVLR